MLTYDQVALMDPLQLLHFLTGETMLNVPARIFNPTNPSDFLLHRTLAHGISQYVVRGQRPGDFLCCCLAGSWLNAILHADTGSLLQLAYVARFMDAHVPTEARGSEAAIVAWCEKGGKEGPNKLSEKPA